VEAIDREDFLGSNRSRRLLALLLVAACTGLAACGGDDEPPDTQVVVPEETATPEAADASATPSVDGYLISVNQRRLVLRTQQGEETFRISLADLPTLGLRICNPTPASPASASASSASRSAASASSRAPSRSRRPSDHGRYDDDHSA